MDVGKNAGGVLFSEMTPDAAWESEFNAWYDEEHIPIRMGAPGFLGAQRYRNVDGPDYLAVYDMTSPAALSTPEYQRIKGEPSATTKTMLGGVTGFTRYIGERFSETKRDGAKDHELAPILYAVFFDVPLEAHAQFDAWYEQDHAPTLMKCKDWLMVRRFRIVDGAPGNWTHLALHYLADVAALESPERAEARNSPWRARLASEPWFKGKYAVFSKQGERFEATR
jgi:hypothetical protein